MFDLVLALVEADSGLHQWPQVPHVLQFVPLCDFPHLPALIVPVMGGIGFDPVEDIGQILPSGCDSGLDRVSPHGFNK